MSGWLARIVWGFRGVQVYALVGKSGTGKSFRARLVMEKYNIQLLVDDGLLIEDQRIVTGRSAKRESNQMAAVRTALFTVREHRHEVRQAIEKLRFKRILIIGTSDRMISKICTALRLPDPRKIIRIQEIASDDEIQTAMNHRRLQGRHVIPVPTIEVHRNYPRIMADSIKVIWKRGLGLVQRDKAYDKTVVRPDFTTKGSVTISKSALTQMVMHCVAEFTPGLTVTRLNIKYDQRGYHLGVHVQVPYRLELRGSIHGLQQYTIDHVERFTGIIIDELNIIIDNVTGESYNDTSKRKDGGSG